MARGKGAKYMSCGAEAGLWELGEEPPFAGAFPERPPPQFAQTPQAGHLSASWRLQPDFRAHPSPQARESVQQSQTHSPLASRGPATRRQKRSQSSFVSPHLHLVPCRICTQTAPAAKQGKKGQTPRLKPPKRPKDAPSPGQLLVRGSLLQARPPKLSGPLMSSCKVLSALYFFPQEPLWQGHGVKQPE